MCVFFNDTATTEIYTLSLHDALPISGFRSAQQDTASAFGSDAPARGVFPVSVVDVHHDVSSQSKALRSEEHTSELQSRQYLVCRLLLEKKNKSHTLPSDYIVYFHHST